MASNKNWSSSRPDDIPLELSSGGVPLPVIKDRDLRALIFDKKALRDDWQADLLTDGKSDGKHERRRVYLDQQVSVGPCRGRYFLFRRASLRDPNNDWTVGIAFVDLQGHRYRLMRCNGPHGGHLNKIEGERLPVGPHVHYVTERYLTDRTTWEDGFAVSTKAFSDIHGAVSHLVSVAQLYVPGRLWTVDR